jgi:hypothetical protein
MSWMRVLGPSSFPITLSGHRIRQQLGPNVRAGGCSGAFRFALLPIPLANSQN